MTEMMDAPEAMIKAMSDMPEIREAFGTIGAITQLVGGELETEFNIKNARTGKMRTIRVIARDTTDDENADVHKAVDALKSAKVPTEGRSDLAKGKPDDR